MRPFLKFTVLRLGLFVAALLVLYVLQLRGALLVVVAALVSLALSYVLLRGPRQELAEVLAARASRRTGGRPTLEQRLADDAAAEDAAADRRDSEGPQAPSS